MSLLSKTFVALAATGFAISKARNDLAHAEEE